MTVVNILIAAVVLGLMGLLFGLLLMGTEKVFAIPADEKRDAVRAALPGANCGACGYPGCDGFAEAVVRGNAKPNGCAPAGEKGAAEIASAYNLNDFASDIIAGVILFFILGSEFFINYKAIFRGHAGKEVC